MQLHNHTVCNPKDRSLRHLKKTVNVWYSSKKSSSSWITLLNLEKTYRLLDLCEELSFGERVNFASLDPTAPINSNDIANHFEHGYEKGQCTLTILHPVILSHYVINSFCEAFKWIPEMSEFDVTAFFKIDQSQELLHAFLGSSVESDTESHLTPEIRVTVFKCLALTILRRACQFTFGLPIPFGFVTDISWYTKTIQMLVSLSVVDPKDSCRSFTELIGGYNSLLMTHNRCSRFQVFSTNRPGLSQYGLI